MRWANSRFLAFLLRCLCVVPSLVLFPTIGFTEEAQDIRDIPSCEYCGMHRQAYAHSRMLIVYADGTRFGACSLHCAALNLVIHLGWQLEAIWAADYDSKRLVPAETATWVIGGSKPGVMTKRAKWAFESPRDARRFITANGGRTASFDEAMQATYEDMYQDTRMIRARRQIRKMNPH